MPTLTRNGVTLWLAGAGAGIAYLLADGRPPTLWSYHDWLKAGAALAAWGVGKLQSSPLPSTHEVATAQVGSAPEVSVGPLSRKDL